MKMKSVKKHALKKLSLSWSKSIQIKSNWIIPSSSLGFRWNHFFHLANKKNWFSNRKHLNTFISTTNDNHYRITLMQQYQFGFEVVGLPDWNEWCSSINSMTCSTCWLLMSWSLWRSPQGLELYLQKFVIGFHYLQWYLRERKKLWRGGLLC